MAATDTLELILRSKKIGDAAKQSEKELRELDKTSKEASKTSKLFNANIKSLAAGFAAAGAAGLAAKKVFDFSKEGAALLRLEETGEILAASMGENMDSIVAAIKEASNNTISESDAMLLANQALRADVARTPEEFRKMTTAAIALGRALGKDALTSLNDYVTGSGRLSVQILENLKIVKPLSQIYEEYAAEIGITATELDSLGKKKAVLNEAMRAAKPLLNDEGKLVADAATGYEQLDTAIQDLTDTWKEMLGTALGPFLTESMESIQTSLKLNEITEEMGLVLRVVGDEYHYVDRAGKDWGKTQVEVVQNFQQMRDELQLNIDIMAKGRENYRLMSQEIESVITPLEDFDLAAKTANIDLGDYLTTNKQIIEWYQSEGFQLYLQAAEVMRQVESGALGAAEGMKRLNTITRQATILENIEWAEKSGYFRAPKATRPGKQMGEFQHGGSVTMPQGTGIDNRLFVARVSDGERIDFTPRYQSPTQQSSGSGGLNVHGDVNITNDLSAKAFERMLRDYAGV